MREKAEVMKKRKCNVMECVRKERENGEANGINYVQLLVSNNHLIFGATLKDQENKGPPEFPL